MRNLLQFTKRKWILLLSLIPTYKKYLLDWNRISLLPLWSADPDQSPNPRRIHVVVAVVMTNWSLTPFEEPDRDRDKIQKQPLGLVPLVLVTLSWTSITFNFPSSIPIPMVLIIPQIQIQMHNKTWERFWHVMNPFSSNKATMSKL